jgi:hypothetical protein
MDRLCGIYSIENVINHKKYIGQSVDIYSRWKRHTKELADGIHNNQYLQSAWNKYGKDNFTFSIIKQCIKDELDYYEVLYIEQYDTMNRDNGYNLETGGRKNKHLSEETLHKISIALSGENNPFYGKTHSEESLSKMRDMVYCPELDRIFDGITIAESELHISKGGISACLSGKQKSAGKHPVTGRPLCWLRVDDVGNVIGDISSHYSDNRVKVVYCIELDKFFNGTRAVERELGITHNCVSACCSGKQKAVIYPKTGEKIHFIYADKLSENLTTQND